jgi:hypothetical protein
MTERLRYADGPTTEVSRVIAASPGELWVYVADINLPARFSSEFQGAEWLDGATEPALGARFRGTNEHPVVGSWQVECTIVGRICGCGRAVGDWCYAVVAQAVRSTGTEVAAECFADDVRRGGVLRGSAFVHCSSQLGIESDG